MTATTLGVADMVLIAADQLAREGQSTIPAAQLVVTAWRKFPKQLGLEGHEDDFPDSNRVLSALMGQRGLAKSGLFRRIAPKLYELTEAGQTKVRRLLGRPPIPNGPPRPAAKVRLPPVEQSFMVRLSASSALRKFESDKAELTFTDAVDFWRLGRASGKVATTRLEWQKDVLLRIETALENGDAVLDDGRVLTASDLRLLKNLDNYLRDRFKRHLGVLQQRKT